MANVLLTLGMITKEALMVLENNLPFAGLVNREYDSTYSQYGVKKGATVSVRKPARYIGRTGPTINVESTVETTVPVTLDTQAGVDVSFTSKEMTLDIDDYRERILVPAMANIANRIEFQGLSNMWSTVYNTVGTPGITPTSVDTYLDAGVRLDEEAVPRDGYRSAILSPKAMAALVKGSKGLFNDQQKVSKQYREGLLGTNTVGLDFYMSQNIPTQVTGIQGGTPVVNGGGQNGATIVTNGWTAAAATRLNVGDVFTIAGVFAVNPQNRTSTGSLRQFTVTAPGVSDAAGNMTISISPSIIASGQFQTVDSVPATGAALGLVGNPNTASPQNLVFHRDAFTLVSVDLEIPPGVKASRASSAKSGLSIRTIQFYDGINDRWITRMDVLYGWAALRPELAVRVAG